MNKKGSVSETLVTTIVVLAVLLVVSIIIYYNKQSISSLINSLFGNLR